MATKEEHRVALDSWVSEPPTHCLINVTKPTLVAVISCLQLALRHPANTGQAAVAARGFIDDALAAIGDTHPAAAAALRLGDESMENVPQLNPPGA